MAEIKIEKKKPMWILIALLLIIGGIIYYIYFTDHETHSESTTEIENTSAQ
jgi:flagellar basal body-associated protein FliL